MRPKPQIGKVYKFPGYVEAEKGRRYQSGHFFIIVAENVSDHKIFGTVLYLTGNWDKDTGMGIGNYAAVEYRYEGKSVPRDDYIEVADSKAEFFESNPHLLPEKEVEKIVEKIVVEEKLVVERVDYYTDTWIDRLYNWYCRKLAHKQEDFV